MIDFSKRTPDKALSKKIHPAEIYDRLDRTTATGPLRPEQQRVLDNWFTHRRTDKDLIIKLHTGAGKTLIGLLIAQSYINSNEGPAIYICPNIYLMQQACAEAQKFGIPYCFVTETNELPDEFIQGKSILITYVQKVFNGFSIFGIGNRSQKVGCLILDDSHACIESISNACTIKVDRKSPAFNQLVNLFEDDLKGQGEGTYQDFKNNNPLTNIPIPYWCWHNHISRVTEILSQQTEDNNIKFAWSILKDQLINCFAYASPAKIEISPFCLPIEKFGIFNTAKHRILMSATTQEDTLFIKGLNLSTTAVQQPLVDSEYSWSGEKMILIPDQICETMDSEDILNRLLNTPHEFGIAALCPSFEKAKKYQKIGATLANEMGDSPAAVFRKVAEFKENPKNRTLVFANRYDGIDLPDNTCRMLILDSLPYYDSLGDRYEMLCRPDSEIVRVKTVQKIEQGLGRSVRGAKDYSVILVVGNDLTKYIRSYNNRSLFSAQTQKQIEVGFEIVDMSKEDESENTDEFELLYSTINQCLGRNEGWKGYYVAKMDEIVALGPNHCSLYTTLQKERRVYDMLRIGDYEQACNILQEIIDCCIDPIEKGWYLQIKAKFKYHSSQHEANKLQVSAFKNNTDLLKPVSGIAYKKIIYSVDDTRLQRIQKAIKDFHSYNDLNLFLTELLGNLAFGVESEKFEKAVHEIGRLLGFVCQRPDKEIRMGPDNLWCIGQNKYIMFECKSQVLDSREHISKSEAGQMEEHCAWFEKEYIGMVSKNILVIPTSVLAKDAFFSQEHDVKILRKKGLTALKQAIRAFFNEFKSYTLCAVTQETIHGWLVTHGLNSLSFLDENLESPR